MEARYLVMTTPEQNHNKYYRMIPGKNGIWTAEYGRVGSAGIKRQYPNKLFNQKLNEKLSKGYVDQTDFHVVTTTASSSSSKYKEIEDKAVKNLIDWLLETNGQIITNSYSVCAHDVTEEAVKEARRLLSSAALTDDVGIFNNLLTKAFSVVPRRMSNVSDYLLTSISEANKVLERENDILDAMATSVAGNVKQNKVKNDASTTILDAFGLNVSEVTENEFKKVVSHLDDVTKGKVDKVFHITNAESRKRFDAYCKEKKFDRGGIKYLYHGSRNQNYWPIVTQGLKLRPSMKIQRAGNMFGYGLYFAPKAQKSAGYTSLNGSYWTNRLGGSCGNKAALLVYKVAMGKSRHLYAYSPEVSNWHEKDCKRGGYDSVYAHAGRDLRNDECIVYNEDACTLSYMITLKN